VEEGIEQEHRWGNQTSLVLRQKSRRRVRGPDHRPELHSKASAKLRDYQSFKSYRERPEVEHTLQQGDEDQGHQGITDHAKRLRVPRQQAIKKVKTLA
jgi:hypothetical protein